MKPREDIYFDPQRFPQSRAGKAQNFLQTKTARPQIIENTGLSEDIYFDPTRHMENPETARFLGFFMLVFW